MRDPLSRLLVVPVQVLALEFCWHREDDKDGDGWFDHGDDDDGDKCDEAGDVL